MKKVTKENGFSKNLIVGLSRAATVAGFLFWAGVGFAQTAVVSGFSGEAVPVQAISETPPAQSDSIVAVTADAYGLSQAPLESLPVMGGTFWIVETNGVIPPFPCLPVQYWNCQAWQMADGIYLVDATGGQVPQAPRLMARQSMTANTVDSVQAAVDAQGNAVANLIEQVQDAQFMRETAAMFGLDMPMLDSGTEYSANFAYSFDTNSLWLEITNVSNGFSYYNLHNATNQVYAIMTTTDLTQPFSVESELFPADTNCQPFNLQNNGRQYLFVRAMDWTGVTENGNTTPDWWFWEYFGTTALSDTNLDSFGSTLLSDYEDGTDPNIISFSLVVTNTYVNTMSVPAQLNITHGWPNYMAVVIDDTNYIADAIWQTYTSSNITVNLGLNGGWHDVWVGLKGLPNNATQTWQRKHINLALPPVIVITNPISTTVSQPLIQIYGYCQEQLASISYDLSNALGVATGLPSEITDQYYDPNSRGFTTNYFECLDVPLTNGLNTVTIHATDLAGNNTTTNFTFTLDYSSKTNPPLVQVTWPSVGTQISGSSFTCRGVIGDPTATVTAQVVFTNGDTNIFYNGIYTNVYVASVERNGNFWLENLPISAGTNIYSIVTKDVVGNTTATNISVVQSSLVLTINPVTPDSQLWQPTVSLSGTISITNYAVWVNGVKGHNNGNGTWSANNVPVNDSGTASFTATAYAPNEQQPDGSYGN